jgi:hypothetical protein
MPSRVQVGASPTSKEEPIRRDSTLNLNLPGGPQQGTKFHIFIVFELRGEDMDVVDVGNSNHLHKIDRNEEYGINRSEISPAAIRACIVYHQQKSLDIENSRASLRD